MTRLVLAALLIAGPLRLGAQEAAPVVTLDSAWSAISRTYWDTAFVKGQWLAARDSLREVARGASSNDDARRLVRALIAVPRQSHFVLIPRSAVTETASVAGEAPGTKPGTAGLELRTIGDTLVTWRVERDGPAARAGVRAGAIVTAIDGVSADSIHALARASSTDPTKVLQLVNLIATRMLGGAAGDSVRLGVRGERARARDVGRTVTIVRGELAGTATRFGNLPPLIVRSTGDSVTLTGHAGRPAHVISFSAWFPAIAPELDGRLFGARGAPGVIIDLRGNPGGVVGMLAGVSGHFLDSAVALGTMRARGATINFLANPRRVDRQGQRVSVIDAPLAILVDGFTGSTSEFFASGMQALGRARVFGVSSAGQALPALMTALPNGDVMMHVIADHEDARGRRVEGGGVQPDEVTPLTRADLLAGRDAALEAARAWLARTARWD